MNFGFKMTQGKNLFKTVDPRDFVVWSKYPPLKITKYGGGVISVSGGTFQGPTAIRHGLSYAPSNLGYIDLDNNGRFWLSNTFMGANSFQTNLNRFTIGADKTNVTIYNVSASGTYSAPFRYILFDEPAYDVASGSDKPIGYPLANYGFKIAKEGKNVLTAKLYEQQINSNTDYLKVFKVFEGSLNVTGSGEFSQQFIHGLGYVPLFFGYALNDFNGEEPLPFSYAVPGAYTGSIFADTQRVVIVLKAPSAGSGALPFRIVVWRNSMNGDN